LMRVGGVCQRKQLHYGVDKRGIAISNQEIYVLH
jgi:hypothetical protein